LANKYHTVIKPPRTGKRGRPKKDQIVVNDDLFCATVKKIRRKNIIIQVIKDIVYGTKEQIEEKFISSPSKKINTSYVERSNADWHLWNSHLSRKSLTFARSIDYLCTKFAICILFYNFIRPHSTLSKRIDKETGKKFTVPITPAMAAGLTDRPLKLSEILALPNATKVGHHQKFYWLKNLSRATAII
jgi:hypothetical protein